jgi:hypothetical protein
MSNYLEENSLIADALFLGFNTLKDQTIEGVTIEDVTKRFGGEVVETDTLTSRLLVGRMGKL